MDPDVAAAPPKPNNLPSQPTELLGRTAEIEAIRALIADERIRLVTITGPGGVGKTRLAVAAADASVEAFPDEVWFVDLAPIVDAELVIPTISTTLGVPETSRSGSLEVLTDYLHDQTMLLVLDNMEQLPGAASSVDALLAECPGLTLLVTSREPLRLRREHVVEAAPLPVPDTTQRTWIVAELAAIPSVALFVDRAMAADPSFGLTDANAGAVAELSRRLEGLPLAIELAASRASLLAPAALVERMEHRLSLLRWDAPDLPARQRTMRATLDWSHDLLTPEDRVVFRRLGVFAGGFTLDAVAAVAATSELGVEALDAVASLARQQQIRVLGRDGGESRFGMLETVREYALERLAESGEEERTRERHMLHFLELIEWTQEALWTQYDETSLKRMTVEQANLRLALDWAITSGNGVVERRISASMWPLWVRLGALREGAERLDAALSRQVEGTPSRDAKLLQGAGLFAGWLGNDDRAADRFEEGLVAARETGDNVLAAHLYGNLGTVAYARGDHQRALQLATEMLALARAEGERTATGLAFLHLVQFANGPTGSPGEREHLRTQLDEPIGHLRAVGNRLFLSPLLAGNARLLAEVDPMAALSPLRESLELAKDVGDLGPISIVPWMAAVLLVERLPVERTVRLVAGIETLTDRVRDLGIRSAIDVYGAPRDHAALAQAGSAARKALGETAFAALKAGLRTRSFAEILDEALAVVDEAATTASASHDTTERGLLSAREREVLALVATGRSNKQIADALFLSPHTVKSHVTSLLNKLDADTRAQVVAIAAERGLL